MVIIDVVVCVALVFVLILLLLTMYLIAQITKRLDSISLGISFIMEEQEKNNKPRATSGDPSGLRDV